MKANTLNSYSGHMSPHSTAIECYTVAGKRKTRGESEKERDTRMRSPLQMKRDDWVAWPHVAVLRLRRDFSTPPCKRKRVACPQIMVAVINFEVDMLPWKNARSRLLTKCGGGHMNNWHGAETGDEPGGITMWFVNLLPKKPSFCMHVLKWEQDSRVHQRFFILPRNKIAGVCGMTRIEKRWTCTESRRVTFAFGSTACCAHCEMEISRSQLILYSVTPCHAQISCVNGTASARRFPARNNFKHWYKNVWAG